MKWQVASQTNRGIVFLITVLGLIFVSPSWAIPITNPGFESDAVGDLATNPQRYNNTSSPSEFFNPLATGWTLLHPTITDPTFTDARLAGIQDLYATYLNTNPDGSPSTSANDNNIMFLNRSNRVSQALTATFVSGVDYTLSVRSGRLLTQSAFAGGSLILGYGTASSFTIVAAVTNAGASAGFDTLPDAAAGGWTTIQLNYTPGLAGPELGQNIVVAFAPTDAFPTIASYIDNFVLIPEPSATALICSATILLWRRKNRE